MKSWRQATLGAAMVVVPTMLVFCVISGHCGAEPANQQRRRAAAIPPSRGYPVRISYQRLSKGDMKMQTLTDRKTVSGRVEHADSSNFQKTVLKADKPVLVDFYADWCGPCRMLSPVLEELARETPGARVVKVNIDDSPELATRYRISSIPALVLFRDGKPVSQLVGLAPKQTLRKMLTE
jgi:thioredoxin 1